MKALGKGILIATTIVCLNSCLSDKSDKLVFDGFIPTPKQDGWEISSPQKENMNNQMVEAAYKLIYREDRFTMARSLLILRNGKLVAEAYPHDKEDANRIANIQSMTKSFTSIMTGIALEKKIIDSPDQKISSILTEKFSAHPEKQSITFHHAMTMTTGTDFDNDTETTTLYQTKDSSIDFILNHRQPYVPGVVFNYHDGAPHLVSSAIQSRYGKPFSDFANENLFSKLSISDWKWESAHDGNTFGAFSLYLKPRDIAKVGQMLLQNGNWNGKQIVNSQWIKSATTPYVNTTSGAPYGYYFWLYPAYGAFSANGHGGQRMMVVPNKNLVIIYTAWGYTSDEMFDSFNELADLIIGSCN